MVTSSKTATDNSTEEPTDATFEEAIDAARSVAVLDTEATGADSVLYAEGGYDDTTCIGIVAWASSASNILLKAAFNEPKSHEVDGVAPGHAAPRRPRSLLFEQAINTEKSDDDNAFAFSVIETYTHHRYKTEKAIVDAPAPWDVPDEMTGPNDVVTELDWKEHHYDPDEDRGVWELDVSGLEQLRKEAVDAGYEWVDERGADEDDDNEQDGLDRLTEVAEEGDEVTIRYLKKNGNGIGTKSGVITDVDTGENDEYGFTTTQGIAFRRDDDQFNQIKRDDNGTPGAFSNSQYPFMVEVVSVEIVPDE